MYNFRLVFLNQCVPKSPNFCKILLGVPQKTVINWLMHFWVIFFLFYILNFTIHIQYIVGKWLVIIINVWTSSLFKITIIIGMYIEMSIWCQCETTLVNRTCMWWICVALSNSLEFKMHASCPYIMFTMWTTIKI